MADLDIRNVSVRFGSFTAVRAVTLHVPDGTALGLAGESGSGKSTLARTIVGLSKPTSGSVLVDGRERRRMPAAERRRLHLVFQDATSALDPRMTAGASVAEALHGRPRAARRARVEELLRKVKLDPAVADALPRRLSGGQRQRVAIARALAADPTVLVADEITSALDVSVQASVLNLLRELHRDLGITVVFISHNLAALRYVCDQLAVMKDGELIEHGETRRVLEAPQSDYTRLLLDSVPRLRR